MSSEKTSNKNWQDIKEKAQVEDEATPKTDLPTPEAKTDKDSKKRTSKLPDSAKELEDWQQEVKELRDENQTLKETAEENHNKWLREIANSRTIQTRATKSVADAEKFALERFVKDLLDVLDSLDKALEHGADENSSEILHGVELTTKMLLDTLANHGVSVLDPVGEPFDPQYHEALTMQATTEAKANTILTTVQKGYVLNGRLLRPARVIVAKSME